MNWLTPATALLLTLFTLPVTASPDDHRIPVSLNDTQKTYVQGHMKTMLEAISQINQHLANQQPEKVAQLVKDMQQQSHQKKPKGLGKALPDDFRALSRQMNGHWKVLMTPTSDIGKVNGKVADILNQCNACHRSYRLK